MNPILQLIAERDQFMRIARQNRIQIILNNKTQPTEAQGGNVMLAHHYDAFIQASIDKTLLLAICEILNRQSFTAHDSVDPIGECHLVSDEYIIALALFRGVLENYLQSLDQVEQKTGFDFFDRIDLLHYYISELQQADFTPAVIIEACQHARESRLFKAEFEISNTKSLFRFHDSFIEFVLYSAHTTNKEKCDYLAEFFKIHFRDTTMVDHIERKCRELHANTHSWCILWNASSLARATRTSTIEPEYQSHELN